MEDGIRVIRIQQPTYEVEPVIDNRFTKNKVEDACTPVVQAYLRDKSWSDDKESNTEISQNVTNLVMEKIRDLDLNRYKVVVQTNLGENKGQTALWCCVVVVGLYVH